MKKKSIKHVKRLIKGIRGIKTSDTKNFCTICGIIYEKGWLYKIDTHDYLFICNSCKEKVRPKITIKAIYSTPFEVNKRRH